jgi:hypothetical protein
MASKPTDIALGDTIIGTGSKTVYKLDGAVLNAWARGDDSLESIATDRDDPKYVNATPNYDNAGTFGNMTADPGEGAHHYLYARTKATVGDRIELSSQTYRNSSYTVFIQMGSTGGALSDNQDAVAVYGQWNGTNLEYTAVDAEGEGEGD